MTNKPVVLFLCTHNSGRSLAAKVLLDHYAQGRVDVRSAGTDPATNSIRPLSPSSRNGNSIRPENFRSH